MKKNELIKQWEEEESHAFQGWDFSHISGRIDDPDPSWDYRAVIKSYLKETDNLLDMGTGGGEFLLTLKHPYKNTYATEAYEPNYELCLKVLSPLGITVGRTYTDDNFNADDKLPFEDDLFDVIINRHESFDLTEVKRTLRRGGYFITQQVGNKNTNELMQRLNNEDFVFDRTHHTIEKYTTSLEKLGFKIIRTDEDIYPVKVYDVGALVFLAKIIEWEYPGFSVNTHLDKLLECQNEVEKNGFIEATGHRFLIIAQKA